MAIQSRHEEIKVVPPKVVTPKVVPPKVVTPKVVPPKVVTPRYIFSAERHMSWHESDIVLNVHERGKDFID